MAFSHRNKKSSPSSPVVGMDGSLNVRDFGLLSGFPDRRLVSNSLIIVCHISRWERCCTHYPTDLEHSKASDASYDQQLSGPKHMEGERTNGRWLFKPDIFARDGIARAHEAA